MVPATVLNVAYLHIHL